MLMAPHKVSAHFAACFPGGLCCPHAFPITLGHESSYIWGYSFEDIFLNKNIRRLMLPYAEAHAFPIISGHESSYIWGYNLKFLYETKSQEVYVAPEQRHMPFSSP